MIEVTKINGQKILVNPHLFEVVEETPDTMLTLTTGRKIIIKESRQEIKNLVKLQQLTLTKTKSLQNKDFEL